MLSMINRGKLDQSTQEEFEHLIGRLRGFLSQSFDEDGQLIVADPNLAIMPVGGLVPFAGSNAPPGYLLCDGSFVSRVTFKSLFDVIGVTYGAGNGTTSFTLPDLRGRTSIGAGAGAGLSARTLGVALGEEAHVLTTPELPSHFHDITDPGHNHPVLGLDAGGVGQSGVNILVGGGASYKAQNDHGFPFTQAVQTGINATDGKGNNFAHNTMQPSLVVNYIIFAGVDIVARLVV